MYGNRRTRPGSRPEVFDLARELQARLVGQPEVVEAIAPYVQMYRASLSPEGRPAGVFLLLGPTGTGKTRTVESLAEVLHGSDRRLLKVDCGEFQMEHEVAKLIGAPPGYLGHRETQPMLSQARLNAVTSEQSPLAIVLFDEVEKAAPSLSRLLLGVLDRATLRLGDNTTVNFEHSLIFLTANLGSRDIGRALRPDFGFEANRNRPPAAAPQLHRIGVRAARRKFSPEFMNRIDRVVTFRALSAEALERILDQHLIHFQELIDDRLGERAFRVRLSSAARRFLLREGTSHAYGARELKRTLHRHLMQPVAALVAAGRIPPDGQVLAEDDSSGTGLRLSVGA